MAKEKKYATTACLGAVFMLFALFALQGATAAQQNEPGIQVVAVYVNGQTDSAAFTANEKITVPADQEVRLSIMFKGTFSGDNTYMVRAPFARTIMTTSGTITDEENGISTLKIPILKGQGFSLDLIGTVTESSYIDIFKMGNTFETVSHFTVVPITPSEKAPAITDAPEDTYGSLAPQIAIAEENLNRLRELSKEYPLLESQLENAKLYCTKQEYDKAIPLLDNIIMQTSEILERYDSLNDKIPVIEEQAAKAGTLEKVSTYLVLAKRALNNMDLDEAERLLEEAEKIANPGWVKRMLDSYGTYFMFAVGGLLALFIVKRIVTGGRDLTWNI